MVAKSSATSTTTPNYYNEQKRKSKIYASIERTFGSREPNGLVAFYPFDNAYI